MLWMLFRRLQQQISVAVLAMFTMAFLVFCPLLAAGVSSIWEGISTRQRIYLRNMLGRRRSPMYGRDFVLQCWRKSFRKMRYSLWLFFLWLFFLNVFGCFVVLLFLFNEVSSVCCWSKKKKKLLVRVSFKILNFTSGEGLKRIVLTTFISNSS